MFIFFPYRVDVPFKYRPVVNWVFVAAVILIFALQIVELSRYVTRPGGAEEDIEHSITLQYVLNGWTIKGLLGYMWLHGGLLHVIGNLLFLWLFGNAVCSKTGNLLYLPVYVGLGLAAAIGHLLFSGAPAVGASGAINGLVGMYLVFFPENSISCFFCWIFMPHRPVWFSVRSFWLILLWFAFDIFGAMYSAGGVAYFAHIGGFVAGVGLAILLLKTKHVAVERHERSILDLLGLDKKNRPAESRGDFTRRQHKGKNQESEKAESATTSPELEEAPAQFVRFKCKCGQRIKVSGRYAGRMGRCPKCSSCLKIPNG